MRNHTEPGDVCYEPFTGSGSQFVAGEQAERRVYGLEIDPKYVAVTLDRLAVMGLTPVLVEA
jgi:DNA modification methylase